MRWWNNWRNRFILVAGLLSMALVLSMGLGGGNYASAGLPASAGTANSGASVPALAKAVTSAENDGFNKLPWGLQGISYSTLVSMGKVHPIQSAAPTGAGNWKNPFSPLVLPAWGAEHSTGSSAGEPAAGMHPTDPLKAMVSGNFSLESTTDGGNTWGTRSLPNACGDGDVVNAWLGPGYAGGNGALEVCLNPQATVDYTCARSTDGGITWTADANCGTTASTSFFDDREYIWVDRNPSSPFYQRVYLTGALFDAGGSGSYNSVSLRYSSDNGASWGPTNPIAIVNSTEFANGQNHNEYPSLGIEPNGVLGYAWHRGMCCGGPSPINSPNKVMFARSMDGGVSFPFSTTVVTVPLARTVPFNSTSPGGTRWSDTPNIAADPVTPGVFYAIWTQYRADNVPAGSAIFLSKSTDDGATWSSPVIPYNNPNANIFQAFGWVKVTTDHVVHLTYLSGTTSNSAVAQFYVQSTDGGNTWSAPFQLSSTTFGPFGTTTDYEANDVGGYSGSNATILTTWAENSHFARLGIYGIGTPTPTNTPCSPVPCTNTPTSTSTNTFTATPTPTFTQTPTATPTISTCGTNSNYQYTSGTLPIVPGTTDIGNHSDDGTTNIALPFPFSLYGVSYSSANVSSNGNLQFTSNNTNYNNGCLPDATFQNTIFPFWDDLYTADSANGEGVFTSVSGSAPNRIFNIEWRAVYCCTGGVPVVNFEIRLYENPSPYLSRFDVIYGSTLQDRASSTVGVQNGTGAGGYFTQAICNTAVSPNTSYTFVQTPCGTATFTVTGTPPTSTRTNTSTNTPIPTNTPTATPTVCGGISILIVGADCGTAPNTLANNLRALPSVRQVDIFDATTGTPSLALLEQYDEVVPFSNCGYSDPVTLGNNLADYEDAHGAVFALNFDWYGGTQSIQGRWSTGGYSPFNNNATTNFASSSLNSCTFGPLCGGIVNAPTTLYRETVVLAAGATAAGNWADSSLALGYIGRTAGMSGYAGDSADNWSGDFATLIANWGNYINPRVCGTPTFTVTGTPPTATRTNTPSNTPSNTPTSTFTFTSTATPTHGSPTATPTCGGPTGPWVIATPYPSTIARYAFAQAGNSFYVISGVSGGAIVNTVYRYDIGTDTWTSLAPIPIGSEAPGAAIYNNKIYVAPGNAQTAFQIYDIATNTWTSGAAFPGVGYGEAVGAFNGNVFVVGGNNTQATWIYNIAANTWSSGTAAPSIYYVGGYQQVGQFLYMIGSYGSSPLSKNGLPLSSVLMRGKGAPNAPDANSTTSMRLDMGTGTFSVGPAWLGRADFALASFGGKLYAIGGDPTGGTYFDASTEVDELDVSAWPAGTWAISGPALPTARQGNQAGFSGSNTIWSVGGLYGPTCCTFINENTYRFQGCAPTSTPTVTGTPPTATRTLTPTSTPCGVNTNYQYTAGTLPLVPGTTDIGLHTDDGTTNIALPFTYNLYGAPYNSANVSSNGTFQFTSNNANYANGCLPDATFQDTIFPFWDDLYTADTANGEGVFTSVSGSAPNRIFNIEWRAVYCCTGGAPVVNFEIRLYEGQNTFDVIYGSNLQDRSSATVGVQQGTGTLFTQAICNSAISPSTSFTFTQPSCGPTPTATPAANILVGHVTYQGISQPSTRNQQPITLTLCVGGSSQNFVTSTDTSAHFTVTLALPSGNYNYKVKDYKNLSNGGTLTLNSGTTNVEFGTLRAGDANNNDVVNTTDFTLLKNAFGTSNNLNTDFNNDGITNTTDFTLLKGNFGLVGQGITCP